MPYIPELLEYKNNVFVETGTYCGDTVEMVKGHYENVISMELSPSYYDVATKRFEKDEWVNIYYANSRTDLYGIIESISGKITFWLDSHWSDVPNVGLDGVSICPILYELEQIKRHPIHTHTIIIDDMRLMNGHDFPVTKLEILMKLREINPKYRLRYYNDYTAEKDILVAFIPEPTIDIKSIETNEIKSIETNEIKSIETNEIKSIENNEDKLTIERLLGMDIKPVGCKILVL